MALARRAQMIELQYKDRVLPQPVILYLGTAETRDSLMVCPALEKYVGEQLHLESLAAKERRKAPRRRRTSSLLAIGRSGSGQNMPSGVVDGGQHRQRHASPQCLLPVPPLEPVTISSPLHAVQCGASVSDWATAVSCFGYSHQFQVVQRVCRFSTVERAYLEVQRALRLTRWFSGNDVCGPRVPFQQGLAALPRARWQPIDTVSCLPPRALGLAETCRHSLLCDPRG